MPSAAQSGGATSGYWFYGLGLGFKKIFEKKGEALYGFAF